jgi:hypothetical protein
MKRLFSVIFVLVFVSSMALAQDFAKEGVIEFGGTASFNSIQMIANGESYGDASSVITLTPQVGYFLMEGVEVGVDPFEFTSTSSGGNTSSTLGFWAFGAYHFVSGSSTYPYLQALVGYTSMTAASETASGLSYGLAGGAKFEIAGGLLLNAQASYKFYTYNPSGADKRFGANVLSVGVGLSGFLK